MKIFSSKGEKSTAFERAFFAGGLIIAAAVITPGISETIQTKRLFSAADPALLEKCRESSHYSPWRFWNSEIQAYSTCIVTAKDPKVQNAAGKYLLRGKQGDFTVQSKDTPEAKTP
jgi:hypothetical protein